MMTAGNAEGNAPRDTATCPTCGGLGKRVRAWDLTLLGGKRGKQVQRCVSCRGTGQVDPVRVCSACGQWVDMCKCAKSKLVRQWKVNSMNGVVWIEKDERWRVEFRRGNQHYYMGQFPDKAMAIRLRMEAENTPTEQLPALRKKYADLKKAARAAASEPEPEPAETHSLGLTCEEFATTIAQLDQEAPASSDDEIDTGTPLWDTADDLNEKLIAARTAERRYQDCLVVFNEAQEQVCAAEARAVEAWNDLAKALAGLSQTPAFDKSWLGFIREEIARS